MLVVIFLRGGGVNVLLLLIVSDGSAVWLFVCVGGLGFQGSFGCWHHWHSFVSVLSYQWFLTRVHCCRFPMILLSVFVISLSVGRSLGLVLNDFRKSCFRGLGSAFVGILFSGL